MTTRCPNCDTPLAIVRAATPAPAPQESAKGCTCNRNYVDDDEHAPDCGQPQSPASGEGYDWTKYYKFDEDYGQYSCIACRAFCGRTVPPSPCESCHGCRTKSSPHTCHNSPANPDSSPPPTAITDERLAELEKRLGTAIGVIGPTECRKIITRLRASEARLREVEKERDEAREIAEDACWMMERCHACGHRLRFSASGCPQCRAKAVAPWKEPKTMPDNCGCERCTDARQAAKIDPPTP